MNNLENQIIDLIDGSLYLLSNAKPSEWAESKRVMSTENSPKPGKFSFNHTPYTKEMLDCLSPNHPARVIVIMKGAQMGMALDVETDIPTEFGWKKMLNIKVGDKVFSEKGTLVEVVKATDIMKNHECFNVYFSDGSIIKCDAEHLWEVWDEKKYETRKKKVLNTKELSTTFKNRNRNRYAIDNSLPLILDKKDLLIDPYLLGVWLGDGHTKGNRITAELKDAIELEEIFKSKNINCFFTPYKENKNVVSVHIRKPKDECAYGHKYTMPKISGANVCRICSSNRYHKIELPIKHQRIGELFEKLNLYGNKHIPQEYLRASVEQRLELLQGLMDTDGTIDINGHCEFYQVDKNLSEQVFELICSLGLKPKMTIRNNIGKYISLNNSGKKYKMQNIHRISFSAYSEMPVFKLSRKRNRLKSISELRISEINRRRIINIEKCESVDVKCITVNSDTHLYLAGKTFIPTHNSTGVIENAIGYIIDQNPGPILFLTGHADLAEEAMNGKIDQMIDSCGLRTLIRPNVLRKKNQRTGDTNKSKEFPGGSLTAGSIGNHKLLRQRSVRYGFMDDVDAAKGSTKESGSTVSMIEQRFASYSDKMKLFYISTPEVKQTSNIEPLYLLGDQRKFFVPCPLCGEFITLEWSIEVEGKMCGINYERDDNGNLVDGSVGYICQCCGEKFTERHKYEMNLHGEWRPTATPSEVGYYSYQISSLYAAPGMYDWEHYVRQYIKANPSNGQQKTREMQTFINLVLGETYEELGEAPKANQLQQNTRQYEIGLIPEHISQADGNGQIVLLTCASDLNGTVDDARLDYEICAFSESGASYSIAHGSIGTFVPRESTIKNKQDREHWTYRKGEPNSVWGKFDEVINKIYMTDTGRKMKIMVTGVDTGHYTNHAYEFIDTARSYVIGIKGDKDKPRRFGIDTPSFKHAKERADLYIAEVNQIKDDLADFMKLRWNKSLDQPANFMNFPTPSGGLYTYNDYYSHFEAENRVVEEKKDGTGLTFLWKKKNSAVQNHLWDCRVYNLVLKDIMNSLVCKELKMKTYTWKDYCDIVLGRV